MNTGNPFRNELAEFVYMRTYSRWRDDLNRRETWSETVTRATDFLFKRAGDALDEQTRNLIYKYIYEHKALPSMRLLWSAGPAAENSEIALYNCSYAAMDNLRTFDEALFILMHGTGFGFSVEAEFVEQLPRIFKIKNLSAVKHVIEDSREGWARALRLGIETWYQGGDVEFDYSLVRPAGARLYTMGGRSSGPGPLKRLLDFVRDKIRSRAGRRLRPIDVHDIMCLIGEVVVAGGVRRSSLISFSDLDDHEMRMAKYGAFYNTHPYRSMANNSVVYNEKPSSAAFMDEFVSLVKSGSGERGIYNRENAISTAPRRRKYSSFASNPCMEVILRSAEFCNLTSVICRPEDPFETLAEKVKVASILGTIQSTFTNFPYIREEWKKNCEEERLLGVSLSGQMDSKVIQDPDVQERLRKIAIETNAEYALKLGINQSVAVTCVKPEGTSSQLVDSASGLHNRWSKYYIRRIRISATDPLFHLMEAHGVPVEPEVGQDPATASTWVIEFPVKAPDGAATRHSRTALEQMEYWKQSKLKWCEHSASCTIYVKEAEWPSVMAWVYDNWKIVGGLSFLPSEDHVYRLAPYEEITKEEYEKRVAVFPKIDYSQLSAFENDDQTTGARDYSCVGGSCDI